MRLPTSFACEIMIGILAMFPSFLLDTRRRGNGEPTEASYCQHSDIFTIAKIFPSLSYAS
jgi:hypothetical protein